MDFMFDEWKQYKEHYGRTRCGPEDGCTTMGCASCAASCLYWREVYINPAGVTFQVSKCTSWAFEVDVDVSLTTLNDVSTKAMSLRPGLSESFEHIDFSLISISTPNDPTIDNCIMRSDNEAALVTCSGKNSVRAGEIGEIQCPTKEDA